MRGKVEPVPQDLRLDFINDEDTYSLPEIKKKHHRLYKTTRRDHDISDLDDPHIIGLMRKGTIPPSLSLRAPPAHIGLTKNRNDIIGITKEEISKNYIIKLQRDRARNDQAVNKSLENLPIKIKQVAQKSLIKSASTSKSKSPSSGRSRPSNRSLPSERLQSGDFERKSFDPPWKKNSGLSGRKRCKLKSLPKIEPGSCDDEKPCSRDNDFQSVSFDPNSLNDLQSEMPYLFSAGFQGYQNRVRLYRKKPVVAFGKTFASSGGLKNQHSISSAITNGHQSSHHEFQKHYQRVLDSNLQPHFVKTSLIKGQSVNKRYEKLQNIIKPIEHDGREELFAIKSVQRINQPFIFTSPASPTRVPNPSLYSEALNSEHSNINRQAFSPQSRTSTMADYDSRENSFAEDQENINNSYYDQGQTNAPEERQDTGQLLVPPLSLERLRAHEHNTSAPSKKSNALCNLTDITERDESNLTKTTKSDFGPDMKISVKINYKSKQEVIEENHSTVSASSIQSKESLNPQNMSKSHSLDNRRSSSNLSSQSTLDSLRVRGRILKEKPIIDEDTSNSSDVQNDNDVKSVHELQYSDDEENQVNMIIVDLNNLKTVKTPKKMRRSNTDKSLKTGSKEAEETKSSLLDSHNTDQSEFIHNKDREEFFITHEDSGSALSDFDEHIIATPRPEKRIHPKDNTPRTEIDDSGISISTYDNDGVKC